MYSDVTDVPQPFKEYHTECRGKHLRNTYAGHNMTERQRRSYLRRRAGHGPPLLLLRPPASGAAGRASVRVLAAPGGGRAAVGAARRVLARRRRVLPGPGLPRRARVCRRPRVARLLGRLPPASAVRPVRALGEGGLLGSLVVHAVGSRRCTTAVGGRRGSR